MSRKSGWMLLLTAALVASVAHLGAPPPAQAADRAKEQKAASDAKTAAARKLPDAILGDWSGKLGASVRLILHVEKEAGGGLKATVDSPVQKAMGLEVYAIAVTGDSLKFVMQKIGAKYAGLINPERTEIDGVWSQGGMDVPLVFRPQTAEGDADSERPQEPKPPYPYDAIEVAYPNPNAPGVTLAGTLTVPKGAKGSPCAVLITGSGQEDRDETVFGHKPFLVIADYLTRHGVAVLRSDDRGVGGSTGSAENSTSEDFAGDIAAAVAFLKTRGEIDSTKIGLIGHSEGGLIGQMVAARDRSVAFLVLLAGPGLPGDSILIAQSFAISKSMGRSDSLALSAQRAQRELMLAAKSAPDSATLATAIKAALKQQIASLPEEQRAMIGNVDKIAAGQTQAMRTPWMRFFLSHDPRPVLEQIRCPVLALNGEKDIQIVADQNLPAIREALLKGGNKDVTVETVPDLNHLFQTSHSGAISEYQTIRETFSPIALQKIGDWIGARMGRGK